MYPYVLHMDVRRISSKPYWIKTGEAVTHVQLIVSHTFVWALFNILLDLFIPWKNINVGYKIVQ